MTQRGGTRRSAGRKLTRRDGVRPPYAGSELGAKQPRQPFPEPLHPGPVAPHLEGDLPGLELVLLAVIPLLAGLMARGVGFFGNQ